jgi:hypothetical protein
LANIPQQVIIYENRIFLFLSFFKIHCLAMRVQSDVVSFFIPLAAYGKNCIFLKATRLVADAKVV